MGELVVRGLMAPSADARGAAWAGVKRLGLATTRQALAWLKPQLKPRPYTLHLRHTSRGAMEELTRDAPKTLIQH